MLKRWRNRTDTLDTLVNISRALHTASDTETLCQALFDYLIPAIRAGGGSLWLLDETGRNLICRYAAGPESAPRRGQRAPLPAGGPLPPPGFPGDHCAQSTHLNLPLIFGGMPLGVLSLSARPGARNFAPDEHRLCAALADQVALALHNAQLLRYERRAREFQALLRQVGAQFHATLDPEQLLPIVFADVNRVLDSEGLSLWMVGEEGDLVCRQARGGAAESIMGMHVPLGQGIVGIVARSQQPLLIRDALTDARVYRAADEKTGYVTRSLICAPLVSREHTLGVVQAINKKVESGQFTQDDLDLLTSLADSAALALENARLYHELQSSYDATLEALASALDLRDRETEGHSRRVVAYTARLAQAYGLPASAVREAARGALLHDVGKIGVPDSILHKPGQLSQAERAIINQHPRLGYEMLAGIPYLADEVQVVLHHQERYDGDGYPAGLRGDQIPIGARLFAVADALDAITSDRPYRPGRSFEAAIEEIKQGAGEQFDPSVITAFATIPAAEWAALRQSVMAELAARRARRTTGRHTTGDQ